MVSSDDDEEGLIHSPRLRRKCRFSEPEYLDFKTWREKTCCLIRSENHVLMDNDDDLRKAISQAMFLETASKNLIRKRKRQLDVMDKLRNDEGAIGKKLLFENEHKVRKFYGPAYTSVTNEWKDAFERASRPLDAPDTRRPPPSHLPLPPMHVPPPSVFKPCDPVSPFARPPSTTSVTSAMSRAFISSTPRVPFTLTSQHLLPPVVKKDQYDFIRSAAKDEVENVQRQKHNLKNFKARDFGDNTSWRMPYHPVPVPPPKILPFITNYLPPPLLQRSAVPALRESFENDERKVSVTVLEKRNQKFVQLRSESVILAGQ
uniref:Verprolin n=1 Tax=Caenorhabditis tropicalis TaxID=1561998 RepID=A0A1I7UXQ0_9PELO